MRYDERGIAVLTQKNSISSLKKTNEILNTRTYQKHHPIWGAITFFKSKIKKKVELFKFFLRYYEMASLENLTSEGLMILSKLRNVDDYENMSRQQLDSIF